MEIEGIIRSVSTFFVETPVEETPEAVRRSLQMLGEYLDADRVYLVTEQPGLGISHCWCRQARNRDQPDSLCGAHLEKFEDMGWLMDRLRRREPVVIHNVAELDIDGETHHQFLAGRGGGAFLAVAVPLHDGDIGFLGVERLQSRGGWASEDPGLAWVVGELTSHALRRQADHDHLERLLRSKSEFIAQVAHELRTPMTVVLGLSEELVTSERITDQAEAEELMMMIAEQSRELSLIVEDLLVAARLDLGNLTVRPEDVNLAREVQLVDTDAKATGVRLEVDIPETVFAYADPLRLRQIIRNLVTNAVRYGGSQVRIEAHQEADNVSLIVADNGPGVPDEDTERIFESFVRGTVAPGMPAAMGLGLAVSKSLAQLMDGDITYTRAHGWTRFEIRLPTRRS